jgi:cold shock protein
MSTTDSSTQIHAKRLTGQVKWFNNKAGYGFITMKDDDEKDLDIFTHFSTVQVDNIQYKYLVQGEYVEFELATSTNERHENQATQVTGINGGKLMCETRQQRRQAMETSDGPSKPSRRPHRGNQSRQRNGPPSSTKRTVQKESQTEEGSTSDGFVQVEYKRGGTKP